MFDRSALAAIRAGRAGKLPDQLAVSDGASDGNLVNRINALWKKAKANPDLLIYKLQSSAYKYSWMLIPLSVPFVWLLFPFSRRFGLYDHTVFVTYSLCFMLLQIAAISLAVTYDVPVLPVVLLLYVPLHMYRQLRETYATSRGGALARTTALSLFAAISLLLFALALVALTLS
ncbi:hypothetical protein [Novosphingobium sp. Gsoil 351]|uniref:hypothetical protein n=1 Tax=Novosphingobium sp. Gsoil 351 TaxID=2675225 RepID=UPI0018A84C7D